MIICLIASEVGYYTHMLMDVDWTVKAAGEAAQKIAKETAVMEMCVSPETMSEMVRAVAPARGELSIHNVSAYSLTAMGSEWKLAVLLMAASEVLQFVSSLEMDCMQIIISDVSHVYLGVII